MTEHSKEVMERRRQGFEAQIRKREGKKFHAAWDLSRDGDGYESWQTHRSWKDWNAALDSVVIELPYLSRSEYATQHSFNCAAESMGYAREAIESTGLGLRVKA